ncbi:MAG TPA: TonB-dependent receptor plug domain-containing protein [Terriglobia bacterium]|nr:TonB-dependent receptor plug domain-containing protein [Terriglobia bacterium]
MDLYAFRRTGLGVWLVLLLFIPSVFATSQSAIRGVVVDPLGAPVSNATVALIQRGQTVRHTKTDSQGEFQFSSFPPGTYLVRAEASGFTANEGAPIIAKPGAAARLVIHLQIGPLRQQVVVSATGTGMPQSQVGASVTVLSRQELSALHSLDVLDDLRLVPGVTAVQQGRRGGVGSVYIRGGNQNFNKVLLDGIPVNDIGGQFDFANLAASGVDQFEIFRGPNSILYGSDALAGVISISTRRGDTPQPQFAYSVDGGNFHSLRQQASVSGVFRQFDYYSDFMRYDTQNGLPNSSFHNGTYSGNFGWQPASNASVRFTIHHDATGFGSAGPLGLYGIPDDSFQRQQDTDLGLTAQYQTTPRWHNLLRLTSAEIHYFFDNPSPTGIPVNPFGFGPNYVGEPVTLCGANHYCTSGQAILDFNGAYPMPYHNQAAVRTIQGQTDYSFNPRLGVIGGFNYIHEDGFVQPSASPRSASTRDNYDYFLEAHGNAWQRVFATAGAGFEDNAVFGFAVTPRVSLAYYARRPSSSSALGLTKLTFNFGTGIKEPDIFDQGSSLYNLLSALGGGPELIRRYGISPIGAERSRSLDFGAEQGLWSERALLGVTFFDERFHDLIDFVPQSALPQLGVPSEIVAALPFGADVNSDSYRSRGVELNFEARPAQNLMLRAEYTYTGAFVTRSLASGSLFPAVNPAFPNIPIGAYAPLVGGHPFRRPPHSASLVITYSRRRYGVSLNGYFAGEADDSTYLSDAFFGYSMLLPNHNLLAGYHLVGASGWYDLHRGVTIYTRMSNILGEHYQAAFGYPALPFTFRAGIRFTLGGGGIRM